MHTRLVHATAAWIALALLIALFIPVASLPEAHAQACGTAPAPRLTVGQTGRVVVSNGVGNNLRQTANTTATVLGVMPDGEVFTVIAGPQCVENYYWWNVRRWDGQTGWTAEGTSGQYWVEPWPVIGGQLAVGIKPDPAAGRLAYLGQPTATVGLYSMAADGSLPAPLANLPVSITEFAWSPDGARLAFSDGHDVYVVGADGLNLLKLTNTPTAGSSMLAWSPDSARLAFVSDRDGNFEIYTLNAADGSGLARLTAYAGLDVEPAWSPDGTRIAFTSDRDGSPEIYTMSAADGAFVTRLTNSVATDQTPAWSPLGNRIAFLSGRDGNLELYLMNIDGSGVVRLTNTPGNETGLAWSPDGTRIAYVSETQPGTNVTELFSIRADGSDRLQYTADGRQVEHPSWAADGAWIAFASNRAGSFDVYLIRPNGAALVNLTGSLIDERAPAWAPRVVGQPVVLPGSLPGAEDLLLIYDAGVPVFTLKNVSGQPANLRPLSFSGAGITVPAAVWETPTMSSSLDAFMAGGCLMLWPFGIADQPSPPECGAARQGWIVDQTLTFWTQGTFNVLYNNAVVATCDTAAGRCVVDLP